MIAVNRDYSIYVDRVYENSTPGLISARLVIFFPVRVRTGGVFFRQSKQSRKFVSRG